MAGNEAASGWMRTAGDPGYRRSRSWLSFRRNPSMTEQSLAKLNKDMSTAPGELRGRWTRPLGTVAVVMALVSATATFLILTGLTPIVPTQNVVFVALVGNGVLVFFLVVLIALEVWRIWVAWARGRAAARLHVRVVTLFAIVAVLPAILVAIVATITLDRGLDKWFSNRIQAIVGTSLTVAQAYVREHGVNLRAEIIAMAADIDRAQPYFETDRKAFEEFFRTRTKSRSVSLAMLVRGDGTELLRARNDETVKVAVPPRNIFEQTPEDVPLLIAPGTSSEVGAVMKLKRFEDTYLYLSRRIDPRVTQYLRLTEANAAEFRALQDRRGGVQVAFGLMYVGIALIVLLAAIWLGIGFANQLVAPIRRLINAASHVSQGNLLVQVPVNRGEGDLAQLGATFNEMTAQLRSQRDELLYTNAELDERRRFTEAVLAGVSAGVLGLDGNGRIDLVNRSAEQLLEVEGKDLLGRTVGETIPEIAGIVALALDDPHRLPTGQATIVRNGHERNLTVRVTSEFYEGAVRGYVVTLDDITDLVIAQRTSAWADIARRIAHEIKNPLTPIQLSAERLKRKFGNSVTEDRAVFEQCTDTIIRQVGDIGRMVDEFSSFARMPKPVMEVGELGEIVRQTVFMMRVGSPDIAFNVMLPETPVKGYFDRRLIAQALTNVIKNASEAIAAVETADHAGRIDVHVRESETEYVIEVIDNGIGLPGDNRRRLLEPYMTTRDKGTGLGLAIVRKIVEEHHGRIELLDSPEVASGGHGAMIRIVFGKPEGGIEDPHGEAGADKEAVKEKEENGV